MKYIFILLLFSTTVFGLTINESLLKMHAILVPKIYLMDYAFKQKLHNNSIVIALLYNKQSYKSAVSLRNKINAKYKNGIKDYVVKVELVPYNNIAQTNANIYYIFPTSNRNIKKVVNKANSNQALTFAYLEDDLRYGVMLSLNVGSKVKPIINLNAAKLNNITFRPVLLDISKIYTDKLLSNSNLSYDNSFVIYRA